MKKSSYSERPFQPVHDVMMETVFKDVDKTGGGDAADLISLCCIDMHFFDVGCGLSGYEFTHATLHMTGV